MASREQVSLRSGELLGLVAILLVAGLTVYGSMDLLLWEKTMYLARCGDPAEMASAGWEGSLSQFRSVLAMIQVLDRPGQPLPSRANALLSCRYSRDREALFVRFTEPDARFRPGLHEATR